MTTESPLLDTDTLGQQRGPFGKVWEWFANSRIIDRPALPNPGRYEEYQREAQEINNEMFDGLRFDFHRAVNQNLQLSHSLSLASYDPKTPPSYTFAANYGSEKCNLFGRLDLERFRLFGVAVAILPKDVELRVDGQFGPTNEPQQVTAQLHRKGAESNTHFRFEGKQISLTHNQSITKNWSIGTEIFYYMSHAYTQPTIVTKYSWASDNGSRSSVTGLVSTMNAYLNFIHKPTQQTRFCSEFVIMSDGSNVLSISMLTAEFKRRMVTYRAQLSTFGRGILSYSYLFGPFKISFCSEIDWIRDNVRFGLGITFQN